MGNIKYKKIMRTFALASLALATQALTVVEIAELSNGILEGFFEAKDFGDITTCVQDVETVATDAEKAINELKAGGLSNIVQGLKDLGTVVTDVKTAVSDCESITSDDWA